MSPDPELDEQRPERLSDELYMGFALAEARRAFDRDEVPIGAVIVLDGRVLARGHNLTRWRRDPLAHAELRALSRATRATGDLRLPGAVVYTTVEPCFMCAGAMVHARIARVVWAVRDEKFGGGASLGQVLQVAGANHQVDYSEGVRAAEARALLQEFFQSKRMAARQSRIRSGPGADMAKDSVEESGQA
ncbi:MAG: nucleoside deaminase [Planctomycetes bacterium]|nr:nucleoside deaminase [Planctomycetota bacterium]MCB9910396.1 nucleoside deaminase [Planctomycetota bacterium]HPF15213.1 tRNA adenosine(34) deaminase TadA [Planctomycetota bacterium]